MQLKLDYNWWSLHNLNLEKHTYNTFRLQKKDSPIHKTSRIYAPITTYIFIYYKHLNQNSNIYTEKSSFTISYSWLLILIWELIETNYLTAWATGDELIAAADDNLRGFFFICFLPSDFGPFCLTFTPRINWSNNFNSQMMK